MSKYLAEFQKARDAKPISDYAKNIPLGHHRVALDQLRVKTSQKTKEKFVEIEVIILETNSPETQPGQRHSWTWFYAAGGFTGDYASARLNEFLETIKTSINSDQDITEIGAALADEDHPEYARGISLLVEVVEVPSKDDPAKCLKGKNGRDVHNAHWSIVEQGAEEVAATIVLMKSLQEQIASTKSAKPATQQAVASTATSQAASSPTTKVGGIKRLLGGGAK